MKRFLLVSIMICMLVSLAGCKSNSEGNEKDEKTVYRQWEQIQIEFGDYECVLDETSIGFEALKSNPCLDRLDKLNYRDENQNDEYMGEPLIRIRLTEDGETLTYNIYKDIIWYYSDYGYEAYYSEYSKRDFDELLVTVLTVVGDNHYFSDSAYAEEKTDEIILGQDEYYDITKAETFVEGYYITGHPDGDYMYNRAVSENYLYYMEWQYYINSLDLPDTVYFYDLLSDGTTGLERYSEVAKWNAVDMTETNVPGLLLDDIFFGMECVASYNVTTADGELLKAIYEGRDKIYVSYFAEDNMKTIFYEDGMILFGNYGISLDEGMTAEEMAEDMETFSHTLDDYDNEEFQYSYGFNEDNRFDFDAPRERGATIDNPHIVEGYREFFDTAEQFTLYTTSKRADGYMEYHYVTMSGANYYYESGGQMYGEKALIHKDILVDDMLYYDVHEEGKEPEYRVEYPVDEIYDRPFTVGVLQYDYTGLGDDEFQIAYYVTINGEEYICELWLCGATDVYVFCKNGEVVAIESYYGVGKEQQVIEYLSTEADEEKIVPPLQADVVE